MVTKIFFIGVSILKTPISSFLLFAVSGLLLVCIAVHKNWFGIERLYGYLFIFTPVFFVFLFASYAMFSKGYIHRLQIAINPSLDPNAGWKAIVTKTLLENSKFIGRGVMPVEYGMGKFPLPSIDTDFLLTYLIFNVGWIAFFIIAAVLAVFIFIGFIKCFKQKSNLGLFVSVAVLLTFTLQAVGYIITNLGFQLFEPIQLPLISYGNAATVINLALIGFMLSAFRSGDIVRDKTANKYQTYKFISWNDGKLTIYFRK
jgi:cell division protein FtsW (lipid II flippase)